jgi:hypothetical protein
VQVVGQVSDGCGNAGAVYWVESLQLLLSQALKLESVLAQASPQTLPSQLSAHRAWLAHPGYLLIPQSSQQRFIDNPDSHSNPLLAIYLYKIIAFICTRL